MKIAKYKRLNYHPGHCVAEAVSSSIDIKRARRFLSELDPIGQSLTFQTLDDVRDRDGNARDDRTLRRQFHGAPEVVLPKLAKLNRAGAAVYVTANRTDGTGRKAKNIEVVRAVFGDFDNGLPPAGFPLDPSVIVETSNAADAMKCQTWWYIAAGETMSFTNFRAIERRIVSNYDADPNAQDLARILRVPGFLHQKDPSRPYLVRVVGGSRLRYNVSALLKAFPPIPEPQRLPGRVLVLDESTANPYRRQALDDLACEAQRLAAMQDGRRVGVFCAAARLARYAANGVLTVEEVEETMLDAWLASGKRGLVYPHGAIRRALEKGSCDPLPPLMRKYRASSNGGTAL